MLDLVKTPLESPFSFYLHKLVSVRNDLLKLCTLFFLLNRSNSNGQNAEAPTDENYPPESAYTDPTENSKFRAKAVYVRVHHIFSQILNFPFVIVFSRKRNFLYNKK